MNTDNSIFSIGVRPCLSVARHFSAFFSKLLAARGKSPARTDSPDQTGTEYPFSPRKLLIPGKQAGTQVPVLGQAGSGRSRSRRLLPQAARAHLAALAGTPARRLLLLPSCEHLPQLGFLKLAHRGARNLRNEHERVRQLPAGETLRKVRAKFVFGRLSALFQHHRRQRPLPPFR